MNSLDHGQGQLSRQDDPVGKLGIVSDRLVIGDRLLRRNVHLQALGTRHLNGGHIGDDHCIHPDPVGRGEETTRQGQVVIVEEGVQCQIAPDPAPAEPLHDLGQIGQVKGPTGPRPQVQLGQPIIDRTRAGINGGLQGRKIAGRGQDLN